MHSLKVQHSLKHSLGLQGGAQNTAESNIRMKTQY